MDTFIFAYVLLFGLVGSVICLIYVTCMLGESPQLIVLLILSYVIAALIIQDTLFGLSRYFWVAAIGSGMMGYIISSCFPRSAQVLEESKDFIALLIKLNGTFFLMRALFPYLLTLTMPTPTEMITLPPIWQDLHALILSPTLIGIVALSLPVTVWCMMLYAMLVNSDKKNTVKIERIDAP